MLRNDETLFKEPEVLNYDYMPKMIPFREEEQKTIAHCIKPLFQERNGRNLVISGAPGVGKTVACRHVLMELEEETDDIYPLYVNCWQKNTTYKIMSELCDLLSLKFIQNKKTEELFGMVKKAVNKSSAVFVFDEIDKVEDFDFLYSVLEEIHKKSVILVTNYSEWLTNLDSRIKSRLLPEQVTFKPYSAHETKEILKGRLKYAFVPNVWDDDAFELIAKNVVKTGDIRVGLSLLKQAGNFAEDSSSRKITVEHAKKALGTLDDFSINSKEDLDKEALFILELVKKKKEEKIGDLFEFYQKEGGKSVYKTFQRKIKKLEEGKFITVERTSGGKEGNTSVIKASTL